MITEEQKEERKTGIGGSDAAKVIGRSKYGTPYEVYCEKMGINEEKIITNAMSLGIALEPVILNKYQELMQTSLTTNLPTLRDSKLNFLLANIDALDKNKNIIVEAKTARDKKEWGEPGTCEIPFDYLCQVAHYCKIYDVDIAHIFVFFKNTESYELFIYNRNSTFEKVLVDKETKFWHQHILAKIPPTYISLADARTAYKRTGEKVQAIASQSDLLLFKELLEANKQKNIIEKKIDDLKCNLILSMGLATNLVDDMQNKLISWDNRTTKRCNIDKLKTQHPEIYQSFLEEVTSPYFVTNFKYKGE